VDVVRGDDSLEIRGCRRHARAIHTYAELMLRKFVDPGKNVGVLLGQHATALFDVEEDDGLRRESLSSRGGGGGLRVGNTELFGVRFRFEFAIETSVEENEKAESGGLQLCAFSLPRVLVCSWRRIEPVACERKRFMQRGKVFVTGIFVAVEPEVRVVSGEQCCAE